MFDLVVNDSDESSFEYFGKIDDEEEDVTLTGAVVFSTAGTKSVQPIKHQQAPNKAALLIGKLHINLEVMKKQ